MQRAPPGTHAPAVVVRQLQRLPTFFKCSSIMWQYIQVIQVLHQMLNVSSSTMFKASPFGT